MIRRSTAAGLVALLALLWMAPLTGAAAGGEPDAGTRKLLAANGLFQRQMYKLAAEQYGEFLKENPAHRQASSARYALAICRFRLGEYPRAAQELERLLGDSAFKQADDALLVLGHSYTQAGDPSRALVAFEQLLSKYPQSAQAETASLNRAQVLYLLGKKAESAEACEEFLKKYPTSRQRPAALHSLAVAQNALGRHDQAVASAQELLKAHADAPQRWDATLLLGQSLEALGKADAAAEQYRRAAETGSPRQADAQFALGVLEYGRGNYAQAIEVLSKLLAEQRDSPHTPAARYQLGLAQLAASRTRDARSTLEKVVREDSGRANPARYWIAQCDIAEKKYDAALRGLEPLLKIQPPPLESAKLEMDRGRCLMGLGRFEEAAAALGAFAAKYPTHEQAAEAIYRQAFSLHKLGQYAKSLELCGRVDATWGTLAEPVLELKGENLFLMERYTDAAAVFESWGRLATAPEKKLRAGIRRGQCAYFSRDYAKAVDLLQPLSREKLVAGDEELSRGILLLGDALLQLGRNREAAEALRRYVELGRKDKLEAQYKLGLAQLRGEDLAAAERTLAAAMQASTASPWALRAALEYGQLKYRQKEGAQAVAPLRRVAESARPELAAPAAYLLGWIALDGKDHAGAAKWFAAVGEKNPKDPLAAEAIFHQGVALKEGDRPEEAIAAFRSYLKHPQAAPQQNVRARQLVAACLVKLKRHDEALESLSRLAADSATVSDEVLYDLAWTQQALGNAKDAEAAYRRLFTQYPASRLAVAARSELGEMLYQQEKYAEAAALLEKVAADPSAEAKVASLALYRLASCRERLGDAARASATYEEYLKRYPQGELAPWAHYQAGVNLVTVEKLTEAMRHFRAAAESATKPELAAQAILKLGETQAQAGDFAASARTYQQFLQQRGDDKLAYQAQFGMGWALENQKRYGEARQWYEKVIASSSTPTAARAQFQIGETHFAQGELEKALAALLAVADVYAYPEWSARALFEAGRVLEQMKQPAEAARIYQQVVEKHAKSPEAALAANRLKAIGAK